MSHDMIEQQVSIAYQPNKENDTECVMCMVDFQKGESLKMLQCMHYFHPVCVGTWLKKKAVCPKC